MKEKEAENCQVFIKKEKKRRPISKVDSIDSADIIQFKQLYPRETL